MEVHKLLETLHIAERLKDATRHCDTSGGRRESVAEHSWRMTLMAYFVSDEFPDADFEKIFKTYTTMTPLKYRKSGHIFAPSELPMNP